MKTNMLQFAVDVTGFNSYAPPDSSVKFSATLTNGSADSITVPSNYQVWVVAFSIQPGSNVWVDFTGATAAIPAGATFAATTSNLNPGQRTVYAGDTISLITNNATSDVGVEFWPVSYP